MTPRDVARALGKRLAPYTFPLAMSVTLGAVAIRGILSRAERPALPLDDSFIHLQYARRLAEGAFFSYVPGEPYTSGATSFLWPIVLAPFHLLGLRGFSLVWAAWILGTIAHAALAVEVMRLSRRLAGRAAATGAMLMSLGFGAFAWFAWSGMETIPFAWLLLRTARASAAYIEPDPRGKPVRPLEVALLGFLTPLVRPEGALASGLAIAALLGKPSLEHKRSRLFAIAPLFGPLFVPLVHLVLAGHATSSTTMVKWLPANPAYDRDAALAFIASNLRLLWQSVLDGGDWSAVFVPEHWLVPTVLGALALLSCAYRTRLPVHAAFVLLLVLGTMLPTTYLSFLWNRVRYVWPFYGAHFVLFACLSREIGAIASRLGSRAPVTAIASGLFVGALVTKLPWTLSDLATSARAIDHQQVTLGLWAKENLPEDARIGVNDTGAIAYFSGRRTFDVVGLTTEGESIYWVHGAGSRYEHYEKLPAERRPSHFFVYPQWMACSPVLGDELHRETVTDQSILGGQTMIAYVARWDLLGKGALPSKFTKVDGKLVDEIDVADLESEATHDYKRLGGSDQDDVAEMSEEPGCYEAASDGGEVGCAEIADGGRQKRTVDRFTAKLEVGRGARLVLRLSAENDVDLVVRAGGVEVGTIHVGMGAWKERVVEIPPDRVRERTEIEVAPKEQGATFGSFHAWLYQ